MPKRRITGNSQRMIGRSAIRAAAAWWWVGACATANAQSTSPVDDGVTVDNRLDAMQREIERLRQDNQHMKGEIDELRSQTGDNWLTEKRADEIRGLVQDVLADADSRASLLD